MKRCLLLPPHCAVPSPPGRLRGRRWQHGCLPPPPEQAGITNALAVSLASRQPPSLPGLLGNYFPSPSTRSPFTSSLAGIGPRRLSCWDWAG